MRVRVRVGVKVRVRVMTVWTLRLVPSALSPPPSALRPPPSALSPQPSPLTPHPSPLTPILQELFTAELIAACEEGVGIEQPVKPGSARSREPQLAATLMDTPGVVAPRVTHLQGKWDTCVFCGAASALHENGFTIAAARLAELAAQSIPEPDRMHYLCTIIKTRLKGFTSAPIPSSFNPMTDDSPHPVVFALHGSDGSTNHAACKLGIWLFDASRPHALPFGTRAEKQRALNLCVRANDSDVHITYNGIVQTQGVLVPGVRIIPSDKLLDKLLSKRRQPPTSQPEQPKRPRVS